MEDVASRGRLTPLVKSVILDYRKKEFSGGKIVKLLFEKHRVVTTRQTVNGFIARFNRTGRFTSPRQTKQQKVMDIHKNFIKMWLSSNGEMVSSELKLKFEKTFVFSVHESTIRKIRKELGWTARNLQYCQLISNKNKRKRLDFCLEALKTRETFKDTVFVDETSVEMSANGRLFFNHNVTSFEKLPAKAPKPKHSYKVHVWAGISYHGRTDICIFSGIMDSLIYQGILKDNFLPFVRKNFPNGYRLYQDNDRKHTSKSTKEWMNQNSVIDKLIDAPASSPDLNPIENVWSALKDFLQRKIKPRKKDELIAGIRIFWESFTAEQCGRYIDHIHKVIPQVILNSGGPTNF